MVCYNMIHSEEIRLKWLAAMNKYFTTIELIEAHQAMRGGDSWKKNNAIHVAKSTAKREAQFWDEILWIMDKKEEYEREMLLGGGVKV